MLSTIAIRNLLHNTKIDRTLGGNLLPENNNPSFLDLETIKTITVVGDDSLPVAFGLFNKISVNQIYCSVVTLKKGYENKFVIIEPVKANMGIENEFNHLCYKITASRDYEEDNTSLPQYFSAFAEQEYNILHQCVVDKLIDSTIGHKNMDMKRNITVDLYDACNGKYNELNDELWRDRSGFIVGDKYRYNEIEISRSNLCIILQKSEKDLNLTFESLNAKSINAIFEYDSEVAVGDRSDYLEYICKLFGAKGTVAIDSSKRPVGYILSLGKHILQIYGDSTNIVNAMLYKHASQMIEPNLSMFLRMDNHWISKELINASLTVRRVRRFHTRVNPAYVKWQKVYALNVGTNLY